jgi:hypothetical protein
VILPPGGYAVVVGFNPATNAAALANFRVKYGVSTNVPIYGPFDGHLNNAGESIQLYQPDPPQAAPHPDAGFVPYVLVEEVDYGYSSPWPLGADGSGLSLQRRTLGSYGNEPLNWVACAPSPGSGNCFSDADGDGLPDDWELAHRLDPYSSTSDNGALGDPDHDGFNNLKEFLAGTDPLDSRSFLSLVIQRETGGIRLSFLAVAGHSYTIQYRETLNSGSWRPLFQVNAVPVTTLVAFPDVPGNNGTRFYRLVTPGLP